MNQHWKKQFTIIYAGQAFSLLGSAAVQFAVIWWLTVQTESAIVLTTAAIVAFIPNMILGPIAGVWIDRFNRRAVMIAADGLVALSSAVLGAAFLLLDEPPLWFIFLILLIRGLGNTFHGPAMQAAIPLLVPADRLTQAGGWANFVNSISNMAGPVLGAALMDALPLSSIMLVDIMGAAFAIICLLFVKIPDMPDRGGPIHFFTDLRQGFAAMGQNKPLMAVFFPMMLCNILFMPLGSLYPLLIRTHYGGNAWHNGLAEVFFAGGLLVSSLVIGVWGGMKRRFFMASLAIGVLGVASAVSGLVPPHLFWVFLICSFFMGCTGTFINVPLMAYTQETIAPDMMGKVFSLLMTAMTWAMPVGLLISGPVSEAVGIDQWFLWSGVAMIANAFLCRFVSRRYDTETMKPEKMERCKGN